MANEFIIEVEGEEFFTGMQTPDTKPLNTSFTASPPPDRMSIEELGDICRDQKDNWIHVSDPKYGFGKHIEWFNQGRRSSCNAYMIAWIICIIIWRQSNRKVRLCPEWVYAMINRGRDGGSMLDDGMAWAFDHGMPGWFKEAYQRYLKREFTAEEQRFCERDSENQKFAECHQAATDTFENMCLDLFTCLAKRGAVGLAVHAGTNFVKSTGDKAGFDRGNGNHAVVGTGLICFNDRPQSIEDFGIVNPGSWGRRFGKNGVTVLNHKHLYQPGQYHAMYCVTAVNTHSDIVESCRVKN